MAHHGWKFLLTLPFFVVLPHVSLAADATSIAASPAGIYSLDPRHTSILFRINHLGFSYFVGRFDHMEGTFDYNPSAIEKSALDVTVYTNTIDTNDGELDDDLRGQNWFDTIKYPEAVFRTTHIERTGETTARIMGDFTLHGETRDLVLEATLVGAGTMPLTGEQVIGFSAHAKFDRSDYGINNLQPLVGDEVELLLDGEFDKTEDLASNQQEQN